MVLASHIRTYSMPSSLSALNSHSNATVLTFTDLRTAKVTFDRATPTAQIASYVTGGTFDIPLGINIIDIVLPATELVYYQVNVSNVTGATVSWPSLPAGYSVTTIGAGVYRVSNIQTRADWDIIKLARVTMPAGYTINFSATAFIGYETSLTKSWTVAVLATSRALLTSTATIYANGGYIVDNSFYQMQIARVTLTATATKFKRAVAALTSTASITQAIGGFRKLFQSAITSTVSMATLAIKPKVATAAITGTSSILTFADKFTRVTNIAVARGFRTNMGQVIFVSNPPEITDISDTTRRYSINITNVTGGSMGTATADQFPASAISLGAAGFVSGSGGSCFATNLTGSEANAFIQTIYYYPTANYSTSTTFRIRIFNQDWDTGNITVTNTWQGAATDNNLTVVAGTVAAWWPTQGNTINNYSGITWTPTYSQKKYYSTMDYLIVGGGGGHGGNIPADGFLPNAGGSGGAGGRVVYMTAQQFGLPSYDVYAGISGLGGGGANNSGVGSTGGTSYFNGYSAPGGSGGTIGTTPGSAPGGSNGLYSGGVSYPPNFGGGAGSAENGTNADPTLTTSNYGKGGDGTFVTIEGHGYYYAAGGGGRGNNGTGNGVFPTPGCGGRGTFRSGAYYAPGTTAYGGIVVIKLY